jgi:hypothetical protein
MSCWQSPKLKPAHELLQEWWAKTSSAVTIKGSPECTVNAIESRYNVRFPENFRTFLLRAAPADDAWDDNDVYWWDATRLKNFPDETDWAPTNLRFAKYQDQYIFFADHLIWCGAWAINCGDNEDRGYVYWFSSGEHLAARSFTEFVQLYTNNFGGVSYGLQSPTQNA